MVDQKLPRSAGEKLEAIRTAAQHESPTADIVTMLAEVEHGYCSGQPTHFDSFPGITRLK